MKMNHLQARTKQTQNKPCPERSRMSQTNPISPTPGEPALLAFRSFSEGGSKACPEHSRRAEAGLAMTFFGAFLQRVAARPEKTLAL